MDRPSDENDRPAPNVPARDRGDFDRLWRTSLTELYDIKYALDQSAIVAITDARGAITYVNQRFCEISKYSREELLGRDHRIVNSGFHPKEFIRGLWQTIGRGVVWKGEVRNSAKDGSIYWVDTTIVPFCDASGTPYQYLAIRYDITDRKRAEAQLREQATLTRLGEMAAVVAHEVKNPLAGISGALQVIGGRMPADSGDRAVIGDIQARIDSLNEMVQDLLTFARPKPPALATATIGSVLTSTSALLRRDPGLEVEVIIAGDNPTIRADGEQLQNVFFNLFLNAAQAMKGKGRIDVAVEPGGAGYDITIADRGSGLTPEVADKMFEPFFTTKHRGSGLGLPIARRVVEAHGGRLTARPRDGGGAVMVVNLPAAHP